MPPGWKARPSKQYLPPFCGAHQFPQGSRIHGPPESHAFQIYHTSRRICKRQLKHLSQTAHRLNIHHGGFQPSPRIQLNHILHLLEIPIYGAGNRYAKRVNPLF